MSKLIKIDEHSLPHHPHLESADQCFYIFEYTPRQGPHHSSTNDLILNLKKSVDRKGKPEYRYKRQAICEAGDYLRSVFEDDWLGGPTLVPIPCSKTREHPLFDDRITQVLRRMGQGLGVDIRELILQTKDLDPFHDGVRLRPEELAELYALDENLLHPKPSVILLFDDILTNGTHFKAAQSVILQKWPGMTIAGIFLARVVRPDPNGLGFP